MVVTPDATSVTRTLPLMSVPAVSAVDPEIKRPDVAAAKLPSNSRYGGECPRPWAERDDTGSLRIHLFNFIPSWPPQSVSVL